MRNYRRRTAVERAAMLDGISLAIRTLEELRRKHLPRDAPGSETGKL
jgi:hypothetical protein